MRFLEEILRIIDAKENFSILRIERLKVKYLRGLIRNIYSNDYAPYWHLKEKTKYLYQAPKEVCFIFLENYVPEEDYFGTGDFRHKESRRVKELKEEMRDRYNPYIQGERTHNHIVHATDTARQCDQILRYLGYSEGLDLFRQENKFLGFPYYLKGAVNCKIKKMPINDLHAQIAEGADWNNCRLETYPVKKTPHYSALAGEVKPYATYLSKFTGGPIKKYHTVERYLSMLRGFAYLRKPNENSFVIVQEFDGKTVLLDGIHRACLHSFQGNKEITVCQILK